MQTKRILTIGLSAAALLGVGAAGAQLVPGSGVIDRLTGSPSGGWVKFDKQPSTPEYQRVYCIAYEGGLSCDWSDVRDIDVYALSR